MPADDLKYDNANANSKPANLVKSTKMEEKLCVSLLEQDETQPWPSWPLAFEFLLD